MACGIFIQKHQRYHKLELVYFYDQTLQEFYDCIYDHVHVKGWTNYIPVLEAVKQALEEGVLSEGTEPCCSYTPE